MPNKHQIQKADWGEGKGGELRCVCVCDREREREGKSKEKSFFLLVFGDTFFSFFLFFALLARMISEARGKLGSVSREGAWVIAALLGE